MQAQVVRLESMLSKSLSDHADSTRMNEALAERNRLSAEANADLVKQLDDVNAALASTQKRVEELGSRTVLAEQSAGRSATSARQCQDAARELETTVRASADDPLCQLPCTRHRSYMLSSDASTPRASQPPLASRVSCSRKPLSS